MEWGSRDPQITLAVAEEALGQIKSLVLPADPPSFELWYCYANGQNAGLNQAISDLLASGGPIKLTELDEIYTRFLSPFRLIARFDTIGARVSYEIGRTIATLDTAVGKASSFEDQLSRCTRQLEHSPTAPVLRQIVETLLRLSQDMRSENRAYAKALQSSRTQLESLQDDLETIRRESLMDALTGIANRKHFDQWLANALQETSDAKQPLSVLMIDVDHFKSFNDEHGHTVGDRILRLVAQTIKKCVKGQDFVARYGGEEFGVILPKTRLADAVTVAEQVRRSIVAKDLVNRTTQEVLGRLTVSVGVSEYRRGESLEDLINRADKALYLAKNKGRNRVADEAEVERQAAAEQRMRSLAS